mmetsp:Transcript_36829/g.92567  ORF Transcript_36829/g.92567 Transcript_36829/m.92567 type:complete len:353 (+) Transcript_36829:144-1202(+)
MSLHSLFREITSSIWEGAKNESQQSQPLVAGTMQVSQQAESFAATSLQGILLRPPRSVVAETGVAVVPLNSPLLDLRIQSLAAQLLRHQLHHLIAKPPDPQAGTIIICGALQTDDDKALAGSPLETFCHSPRDLVSVHATERRPERNAQVSTLGPRFQPIHQILSEAVVHHLDLVFHVAPSAMDLIELLLREACLLREAVVVLLHPVSNQALVSDGCQCMMPQRRLQVEAAARAGLLCVRSHRMTRLGSIVPNPRRSRETGAGIDDSVASAALPHGRKHSRLGPQDLPAVQPLAGAEGIVPRPGRGIALRRQARGLPSLDLAEEAVPPLDLLLLRRAASGTRDNHNSLLQSL